MPTQHLCVVSVRSILIAFILLMSATASADPPPGYYDPVDSSNPQALRSTLHQVREHTWPQSYGYPDDRNDNYPISDCHALFLGNSGYNSSRKNNPYRTCGRDCTEKPTELNHGRGGGSGSYPGNSNWRSGSGPSGIWETWNGRRGDVARALLYMDVRYEGGTHGITGAAEPDLILTNDASRIQGWETNATGAAYMGELATLLQWHHQDEVDDLELRRNDTVASFQQNRNPFIDHPEWVACVFENACSAPPGACVPDATTLCLNGGRFQVKAEWETGQGASGDGQAVLLTPDTGYFWFFSSANVEAVVKVLDGCGLNRHYWVFAAGLTDVRTTLTVVDTLTGQLRTYVNPSGTRFQPVQDTGAFATCGGGGDCIPASECCKICTNSQACGDSCIRLDFTCHQEKGCACNSWEVCD